MEFTFLYPVPVNRGSGDPNCMEIREKYDRLYIGILVGLLIPFTAYGILLSLYDKLDALDLLHPEGFTATFRERTVALLAIVANVIPMHFFNRRFMLSSMRGLIFPTLLYVILWMYFYGLGLLG